MAEPFRTPDGKAVGFGPDAHQSAKPWGATPMRDGAAAAPGRETMRGPAA